MDLRVFSRCGVILVIQSVSLPTLTAGEVTDSGKPRELSGHADILAGAIQPFREGEERAKFLRAAGADAELSQEEFLSDKEKDGGFVRVFDKWVLIARFDQNRNKTVDWFEAKAYREASWAVIRAKHDIDTSGDLNEQERHDAIHALLDGKLADYFNIACCGGTAGVADAEKVNAELAKKLGLKKMPEFSEMHDIFESRKTRMLADDHLLGGIPESRLLRLTQAPTIEALDKALRPHYEAHLAKFMSEDHWRNMLSLIGEDLKWAIDGNPEGLVHAVDARSRFTGIQHRKADPANEPWAGMAKLDMMFNPPAYRMGFAKNPLTVEWRSAAAYYTDLGGIEDMHPQTRKLLEANHHIITLTLGARAADQFVHTGAPGFGDRPDLYKSVQYRFLYDPKNNFGLYVLPGAQSFMTGEKVAESLSGR